MQAPIASPPTIDRERRWYPRRVIIATLVVGCVAAGFYLLYLFSNVLFVLFVAAVLATAMRPAVLWLERRHIPQPLGVLIVYLVAALATVAILALLAPLLLSQITTLATDIPDYYRQFRTWVASAPIPLVRGVVGRFPAEFPSITQPAQQGGQVSAVGQATGYVRSFGWSAFGAVAIALIAYFWIVDREQIVRAVLLAVPIDRRDAAREIYDALEEKVGAFVRGQVLLCLAIGLISAIAFFAIGVPNALLLAVLAGILEAVPYIGPIGTAVFAVGLTLAQAPDKIWWVVGACIVIQQIENAVLVPRIMDRAVGVNAVVTLLAIAAFGTLLGIGGAIMAIPLAVIVQVLVERMLLNTAQEPNITIEGRDQVALLRYQAQDLGNDLRERIRAQDHETGDELLEEALEVVVGEIDQLLTNFNAPQQAGSAPQSA